MLFLLMGSLTTQFTDSYETVLVFWNLSDTDTHVRRWHTGIGGVPISLCVSCACEHFLVPNSFSFDAYVLIAHWLYNTNIYIITYTNIFCILTTYKRLGENMKLQKGGRIFEIILKCIMHFNIIIYVHIDFGLEPESVFTEQYTKVSRHRFLLNTQHFTFYFLINISFKNHSKFISWSCNELYDNR